MMYCPRCNNTHWVKTRRQTLSDRLAIFMLKRPYRCIKCDRIQIGSVFLDFSWSKSRRPKRKIARAKTNTSDVRCPECGGAVRRSRRRGVERLLFFLRAYRCSTCEARFRAIKFV